MAFTLEFGTLTVAQKQEAADLLQKLEAIDSALADIQTARATAEAIWTKKTNFLNQQKGNIKDAIRALRTASIIETP
jgi:hypothetical protein